MDIHLFWEGPFSLKQLSKVGSDSSDFGIYQIYGYHALYGKDVLLYIGKANWQTFSKRLKQEYWDYSNDPENIKIYFGRIASKSKDYESWETKIDLAEKLLIYAHNPAQNIVNTNKINYEELRHVHVFNWESYRDLFPEVSWKRWSNKFDNFSEDDILKIDDE